MTTNTEVRLAEAEVKALRSYARTDLLNLAPGATDSMWARLDEGVGPRMARLTAARRERDEREREERFAAEERDTMAGALDVFGVLSRAGLAFSTPPGLPEPGEAVLVEFSPVALDYLAERRRGIRASLEGRRGTVEISGATRNETFVLHVLDSIAAQLADAPAPDLKVVA